MTVTSQSTLKELVDETGIIKNELVVCRDNLKTNLSNKGVDVSGTDKMQGLVEKVNEININLYNNIMKIPRTYQIYSPSANLKYFLFPSKYSASCFEIHKDNNIYSLLYQVDDGSGPMRTDKRMWKYSLVTDTSTILCPIAEYTKIFRYNTNLTNKNVIIGDVYYAILGTSTNNFISSYNILSDTWTNPLVTFEANTILYGLIKTTDDRLLATTSRGLYLINLDTKTKTLLSSYNSKMIFEHEYDGKLYGRGYDYYDYGMTELDLQNYSTREIFKDKLPLVVFGKNAITLEIIHNSSSNQYKHNYRFEDLYGKELLPMSSITTNTSTKPNFSFVGGQGRRCYSPDGNLIIEAMYTGQDISIAFNLGYDTQFN